MGRYKISIHILLNQVDIPYRLINYVRVQREWGLEKSLHTLTLGGGGQTHSNVIFSKSIFYIRNRSVEWFGRDDISFV